jgi:fructose-1,6-bisphosphatase/inositol monophosphatase family enzyme
MFSVYLGKNAMPASYEVARASRRTRHLGAASLDLCLVASGAFDVYYLNTRSPARLRIMDLAAGVLIVREAGGLVVDARRRELDLPVTLEARTNLIAAGDRKALEAVP